MESSLLGHWLPDEGPSIKLRVLSKEFETRQKCFIHSIVVVSEVAQGAKECVPMLPFVCDKGVYIHRFEMLQCVWKDIYIMGGKPDAGRHGGKESTCHCRVFCTF